MAVTTTYHMIGRFNRVLSVSPSSLFTAVLASQLNATTRRMRSSVLITTWLPSASPPEPVVIAGDNDVEKITESRRGSVLREKRRETERAISGTGGKSIDNRRTAVHYVARTH